MNIEIVSVYALVKNRRRIMTFDKWFNKQSTLLKAILLLLPVVGWVRMPCKIVRCP